MLLETIKIHDIDKKIKILSIDYLKQQKYYIDNRITHVPALLTINDNNIIFGKDVLDFLFLPNKGIFVTNTNNNTITNNDTNNNEIEPLGMFSHISQNYESIDNNNIIGPISIWESIEEKKVINEKFIANDDSDKSHKKLPSLAEIQEMRNKDIT